MVQYGHVNHRPCFKHSWIIPFLPQILLRFSSRSCSLWCLLCQHPCNLLQIPWSFDSTPPPLCIKLCYWWLKHVFPSLYLLLNLPVILDLVLAPGIASFSASLSWPHGTEFFDSYLKLETFVTLSFCLSHDDPDFCRFFEDVPFDILEQLTDVDYHKSLIANRIWWEFRSWSGAAVFGVLGTAKISPHTVFKCIRADKFDALVSTAFLWVRLNYDYRQWINSHVARLSINWREQKSSGRTSLSLAQVVPRPFFVFSLAQSQWGGIVGFINLGAGKSRLYGIGNLMWRNSITISSELLTMRRL